MIEIPQGVRESEKLARFFDCYCRARGDGLAPRRTDLPMRELAPLMPDVSIIEWRGPRDAIYRLVGTAIVKRVGRDLTGKSIFDLVPENQADQVDLSVEQIVSVPCGALTTYENIYASGQKARAENLSLPLDAGTGKYFMITLYVPSKLNAFDGARPDPVLAANWLAQQFIDLGAGVPNVERTG